MTAPRHRSGAGSPRRRVVIGSVLTAAAAGFVALAVGGGPAALASVTTVVQREGQIVSDSGAGAIPDDYIVILKDSVAKAAVADTASRLTRRGGGQVVRQWSTVMSGFEVKVGRKQAKRIAADPSVAYVEQNRVVRASDTQPNPPSTGLDRIDQRNLPLDKAYTFPNTASNVHAYIIDTGIRASHVTFRGRATTGIDVVDGGAADDCNGHGTHVAGTVGGVEVGVAKGVQLVAVRVLDCNGAGNTAQVIAGIEFVTRNAIKPAVANMSLGGPASFTIDQAVSRSIASGVTFVTAAGNEGVDACGTSPARVGAAITVGAIDGQDNRADFSNLGRCVDIFAPGVDILSSFANSDTAAALLSGTSMATPHVTGAAALILGRNPGLTPQQVASAMVSAGTRGVVRGAGPGSPNLLLFVG